MKSAQKHPINTSTPSGKPTTSGVGSDMKAPTTLLGVGSNSTTGSGAPYGDYEYNRPRDALDRDALSLNASISYAAVQSTGLPPSRPLEFPAPILERAITVPAHIVDHTTGNIFGATSVLMRRPIHAKSCPFHHPRASISPPHGHGRVVTPDIIHTDALSLFTPSTNQKKRQTTEHHRRELSDSSNYSLKYSPCCDSSCNLPYRAYCVRRKICDTAHGSIRLCVVLKRVSANVLNYATSLLDATTAEEKKEEVALPEWETTPELVVVKVTSWSTLQNLRDKHLEDPIKEVAALQLLGIRHPHVISIKDALQNDTHLFCVLPYLSGGTLYDRLFEDRSTSPTGRVTEHQARAYFRQILCGISQLQKKGICHRDLSMNNMVVDENGKVRIIDLGSCLRVPYADPNGGRMSVTDVSANTRRRMMKAQGGHSGPWHHVAPELRSRQEYFDGFTIDLWSAGIVLFEMLVGERPFASPDPSDADFRSICVEGNLAENVRARGEWQLSDIVVDLLQSMLRHDPTERLTLEGIVNHPWVEGIGEMSASSPERDEPQSWLIKTASIDDLDDAVPAKLLLAGLRDSYHRESTFGTASSSEVVMEVDKEDGIVEPQDESAECNRSRCSGLIDDSDEGGKDRKCSWGCIFPTNKFKWRRPLKVATSLPLQSRTCEFS
jgi:serine/threonine protein kinase